MEGEAQREAGASVPTSPRAGLQGQWREHRNGLDGQRGGEQVLTGAEGSGLPSEGCMLQSPEYSMATQGGPSAGRWPHTPAEMKTQDRTG